MFQQIEQQAVAPLLLTARQAATLLNLSERTLYRLTAGGDIPVVKIGPRGVRYDVGDLKSWIARAKNSEKSA